MVSNLHKSRYGVAIAGCIFIMCVAYFLYSNLSEYKKEFALSPSDDSFFDSTQPLYFSTSSRLGPIEQINEGSLRRLNGSIFVYFKPERKLKNATVKLQIDGYNLYVLSPFLTKTVSSKSLLAGNQTLLAPEAGLVDALDYTAAKGISDCILFNGSSRLILEGSQSSFETSPFIFFARWRRLDSAGDRQQIVGHYNWELSARPNRTEFQIGRLTNPEKSFIRISSESNSLVDWENATIIYSPQQQAGYVALYYNDELSGSAYLSNYSVDELYGEKPLSIGMSNHAGSTYLHACVSNVDYATTVPLLASHVELKNVDGAHPLKFSIIGDGYLTGVHLMVNDG